MRNYDKKSILLGLMIGLALLLTAATTGSIDYIFGVKNKSEVDPRSYVFTRTNGAGASGILTSAGANSATLSPCPSGITSNSVNNAYVMITGGTGTQEPVKITSISTSGANCTIGFTTVNTHSGAWVIGPNGNGLQEALIDSITLNKAVHMVGGIYNVYAPIYVPTYTTLRGDGGTDGSGGPGSTSKLLVQSPWNFPVLVAPGAHNTFSDFGIGNNGFSTAAAGQVGIQLGSSTNENNFSSITRVYMDYIYDNVLGVNFTQCHLTDNTFWNTVHVGVTIAAPLNPDGVGCELVNNNFFSYVGGLTAQAWVLIHSTSSTLITGNEFIASQNVAYCVEIDSAASGSGGWVNITGNKCENTSGGGIYIHGDYATFAITGNTMSESSGITGWFGIWLNGSSGVGPHDGTIVGNAIHASGSSNTGIKLSGVYSKMNVSSNTVTSANYGISVEGSPSDVLVGNNTLVNIASVPVYAATNGVIVNTPNPMYWSVISNAGAFGGLGNVGDGSQVFCRDCNSTCSGGSSTGRTCFRENGTWTH